jgi:hypothetical protein
LGVFIAGIAIAMAAYPGGTWWTPARSGHDFRDNFLCDLLHDPALNRQPNRSGAFFATLSMLTLIFGLGVFWSMVERWLKPSSLTRLVRNLGVFGTLPLALVPLTPSNRCPKLHTAAVLLGGLPALTAFLVFSALLLCQSGTARSLRALTACLCMLVLVCLGLYAEGALGSEPAPRMLPVLERGALILLLVWVFMMVHRHSQGARTQT